MIGGLQDPDEVVRASAIDACGSVEGQQQGHLLALLEDDPSPLVRERAALAIGLLRVPEGEGALIAACRRAEPANVRAAAALAAGVFDRQSIVARVVEMPDQTAVRELLRERLKGDARFRLLGRRLSAARHLELRALGTPDDGEAQASLAQGMRSMLDAGERVRLISSLRAFQGEQSRGALLQIVREDPTPEVRTAALTAVGDLLDPEELLAVGARSLGDPSALVRRTAVALFTRVAPARALARLIQLLRVDDDPAVLAAAAGLAEEHFPLFAQVALGLPPESERAVLVIRIARHIVHPDLPGLLPPFARSSSPEVRAAVVDLWRNRPDIADPASLEALTVDPEISVRRAAAGAALAGERYDLLEAMIQDPDAGVRREVAIALGRAAPIRKPGLVTLDRLAADPDMTVRAAAYVARLVQGIALPLPPGLDAQVAAQAVQEGADLPTLRQTARTASSEERRLAAALALALLQDDVAREVARTDPVPSIRHRVSGALELSIVSLPGSFPVIETLTRAFIVFALVVQPVFLLYFLLYNTYTLWLIGLSARQVRRRVAGHFVEDLDLIDEGDLTKPLTMIVPAYNEEVTIVDSVTSLVQCDYPRFEVVVVNDGSTDGTLDRLKHAFRLRRTEVPYRPAIGTARVRAMYEATVPLPPSVMRLIVIDKENGGKADALNAGINASTTPYFVSLDADSILDERALKELMRVIQEDPRVVAVGGQVAIANGCTVRNSHVVSVGLPTRSLPRFQMVEYLRSFTTARTGLDRMRVHPDPERSLRRLREGDRNPRGRLSHAVPAAPADRGVRRRGCGYRL